MEGIVYGGTDANVAAAIYARKAAGIQTYGSTSVQLTDASGRIRTIKFSRPTTVPIYVKITNLVTDATFGGNATIQAAVIAFIGDAAADVNASGLGIGEDVYYNRLMCPLNSVPGVVDYTLKIGTTSANVAAANITITGRQKAVTEASKVVIST